MGYTANFAIKMFQLTSGISSWAPFCVDSNGIFGFYIGHKIKELFNFFEGPSEVKLFDAHLGSV